ncbi:MAG: hypothetical protein RJA61_533 [Candidatus Parcubacteria bacterium]|jgi:putative sigma-54 modulation protein
MIKTNIKATNIELTDSIREYVQKKIDLLEKYVEPNDSSAMCDVEVGKTTMHHKTGDVFKAEMNLHIAGKYVYAVSEKDSLNAALDDVKDEIARSISSHNKKRAGLVRRGGALVKAILKGATYPFRRKNK